MTCKLRLRPLFFIAHSFGGIIVAHVGHSFRSVTVELSQQQVSYQGVSDK